MTAHNLFWGNCKVIVFSHGREIQGTKTITDKHAIKQWIDEHHFAFFGFFILFLRIMVMKMLKCKDENLMMPHFIIMQIINYRIRQVAIRPGNIRYLFTRVGYVISGRVPVSPRLAQKSKIFTAKTRWKQNLPQLSHIWERDVPNP